MIQRLNQLIEEYQAICFKLIAAHNSNRGMWGGLGEMYSVATIRSVFIYRSRSVYRSARRSKNIIVAYAELRQLLKHPVAQELELMTESLRKSCGKESA